jgi:hypothetical protein
VYVFVLPVKYVARNNVVQPIARPTTNWVHQTLPQLEFERPEKTTLLRQWTDKDLLAYPKVDTSVPPPKIPKYHQTMPALAIASPLLDWPPPKIFYRDRDFEYRSACCIADCVRARPPKPRRTPDGWAL